MRTKTPLRMLALRGVFFGRALALLLLPSAAGGVSAQTIAVAWRDVPLSNRLADWQAVSGDHAFRDRRVDPQVRLNLKGHGEPNRLLDQALRPHGHGVAVLPGVAYIGPSAQVDSLRTLIELNNQHVGKLAPGMRRPLTKRASLEWPRLSEPRGLINSLLQAHGLSLENPDAIPHDAWDAGALPAMPLSDCLTVLLFGFDRTWQATPEGVLRVVGVPRPLRIEKSYPFAPQQELKLSDFRREFPAATLERDTQSWRLAGTIEAHERFALLIRGKSAGNRRPPAKLEQRLTLRVTQKPAEAVLYSLASQLGYDVAVDPEHASTVKQALSKTIDLAATQAAPEEVLHQLGELTGLEIELEEERVVVRPGSVEP